MNMEKNRESHIYLCCVPAYTYGCECWCAEMGEILEVLVLEYDFAGTRTRTRTQEVSTRTRTRKSPYSPISVGALRKE